MNMSFPGRIPCFTLLLLLATNRALAQAPGTLDAAFGIAGIARITFLTYQSDCKAATLQTDGKIILAGQYLAGGLGNMAFVRLHTNGSPDNSFGSAGQAIIAFNNANVTVSAVCMAAGGKIVVGGNSNNLSTIVRLTSNGAADNTFGTSGMVSFDGDVTALTDLVVLPDGKMVGCGTADQGSGKLFCAFRRNADGSADNTFGVNGFAYANVGSQPTVTRLAVQPDGKVLLTGTVYSNMTTFYDLVLFRFNANGTPDNTFGANGKVVSVLSTNSAYELGNAIALQQDGKIVAAGRIANTTPAEFVVARYNANGVLDNTFGTNGAAKIDFYAGASALDEAKAVAIQSDGKIIVGGTALNGSTREMALARLTKTGALDAGFGTGGKTTTAIGTKVFGDAMVLQPDGKIVLAGTATVSSQNQFAAARYHVGAVLGTAEKNAGLKGLRVYPNPARPGETIALEFGLAQPGNCRCALISLDGRLLLQYPAQLLHGGNQLVELKIPEGMPSGQVVLRIETEAGTTAVPLQLR
ncbi:MAG: hypothetical protein IPH12_17285 [Saprospirales bacterium]|nr:hypothetical protein [Saprospirales bacterium]